MKISIKKIETPHEQNEAFCIRKKVFVEEQGVPLKDEFDCYEAEAEHVIIYCNHTPAGTGRWRLCEGVAKIERICILPNYRHYGLGRTIINALENLAREKNIAKAKLHAQTHAEGFYQKLGYETQSNVFMEDTLPHILMVKTLLHL